MGMVIRIDAWRWIVISMEHMVFETPQNPLTVGYLTSSHGPTSGCSHCHDGYEIYLPVNARGNCFIDGHQYKLQPKQLYVINGCRIHAIQCESESYVRTGITFLPAFVLGSIGQLSTDGVLAPFIHYHPQRSYQIPVEANQWDELHELARELGEESRLPKPHSALRQRVLLLNMLTLIVRLYEAAWPLAQPPVVSELVQSVLAYLEQNFPDDLSPSYVASKLHVSESHLCHVFKRYTGDTVGGYLRTLRLEKARQLLRTTSQPVTDIALQVGFTNVTHFSSLFHQSTGLSPREYRRQWNESSPSQLDEMKECNQTKVLCNNTKDVEAYPEL